jgi:DNA-binding response OmpR family regulator
MLNEDAIANQQERLDIHRRNLALRLKQLAMIGMATVPPEVIQAIREERKGIEQIKSTLRSNGIAVEDYPDDNESVPALIQPEIPSSSTSTPSPENQVHDESSKSHPNILLVDDDTAITNNLAPVLKRSGFNVVVAMDGKTALQHVSVHSLDLVILDVDIPEPNGREVLRQLRRDGNWIPVILLTRLGASIERAMAIDEGADDYLNKPYDLYELIARMRAVMRRARPGQPPPSAVVILVSGDLRLDRRVRQATRAKKELQLTKGQLDLLEYFMTHPDEIITSERILKEVYGFTNTTSDLIVERRVGELSQILDDEVAPQRFIRTVYGEGYQFVGKVETIQ